MFQVSAGALAQIVPRATCEGIGSVTVKWWSLRDVSVALADARGARPSALSVRLDPSVTGDAMDHQRNVFSFGTWISSACKRQDAGLP